ncbi:MAG TPA: NADH-quinone oxidoreductase subunit D, partial [Pirellulales bacterium]|nr:NADH-quinone oxidoreductase subunit D [Pirellulales bacterium]
YLHRCAEKIGENLTPKQWIPYTDRMDYLAGMNMNLGWALTVEKLMKLELAEKARHLRVIIAEMGRIASHLVGMGAYGLDLGTFSPFLYAFREREKILDLFEMACGARLTYSYLTVGGATHDLPPGWLKQCEKFLDQLLPIIDEYHALLTTNTIFVRRTADIGVLSPEMAISYGCTGPVLRGSGVDWDLRRDGEDRYTEMYDGYAFEVIVQKDGHYPQDHKYPPVPESAVLGDCWHRFYVRMLEVMQSIDLVRQAMDRYSTAEGSHNVPLKLNEKLPKGEVYLETEAPRGQMGFYLVSDGSPIPWRARARSSCFCNLSVTHEICRGCLLADVPAIVGSLDIVMGEIDR